MDKKTNTVAYEAPRIEDHGDLTELTAATTSGSFFDGNFHVGEAIPPNIQQSTP